MRAETAAALDRVKASLADRPRGDEMRIVPGEDGTPEAAHVQPFGENFAGDVVELVDSVAVDKLTPVARMLRTGCKDLAPTRRVWNRTADLWHLLGLLGQDPEADTEIAEG